MDGGFGWLFVDLIIVIVVFCSCVLDSLGLGFGECSCLLVVNYGCC